MPLSTHINIEGKAFTLQLLLDDSIKTFDLKARELAWTAIAYASYLPPQNNWTNRDGKVFTFDDLARTLLETDIEQQSCGGAHILYALTLFLRVDSQKPCLSPQVRDQILRRLRDSVALLVRSQHSDGSWSLLWDEPTKLKPAYVNAKPLKLLVTGHMLEWMEYLPVDLQPKAIVYKRAADWLSGALNDLASQHPFPAIMFCPRTHAICALRNLIRAQGSAEMSIGLCPPQLYGRIPSTLLAKRWRQESSFPLYSFQDRSFACSDSCL